jgi:two-component system phosphate regulon response regulator PhoB
MAEKNKIFVIEDDYPVLESLKQLLVLSGFDVEGTTDSTEAVARIKAFKPQVILLDLLMPHVGGLEICELLNKEPETQGIPILVTSAIGDEKDIKKVYHLGVIGYFKKPYEFEDLLKEIKKVLAYKSTGFGDARTG